MTVGKQDKRELGLKERLKSIAEKLLIQFAYVKSRHPGVFLGAI